MLDHGALAPRLSPPPAWSTSRIARRVWPWARIVEARGDEIVSRLHARRVRSTAAALVAGALICSPLLPLTVRASAAGPAPIRLSIPAGFRPVKRHRLKPPLPRVDWIVHSQHKAIDNARADEAIGSAGARLVASRDGEALASGPSQLSASWSIWALGRAACGWYASLAARAVPRRPGFCAPVRYDASLGDANLHL